jgi:hypothetical protein
MKYTCPECGKRYRTADMQEVIAGNMWWCKPCFKRKSGHIAKAVLDGCGIHEGQTFHELRSSQVERLLAHADNVGYRKPANANGSRARSFYEKLLRKIEQGKNVHA